MPEPLPEKRHDLRGRPAGRPPERVVAGLHRRQGGVRAPPARGRAAGRRGHLVRAPEVGPAARGRGRPDGAARRDRPRLPRAGAQRARPRPGPRARRPARRDLRLRHRDLRAEEPQPQPRRAVRDVRADRRPGPRGRARRPRLRLDVLRRPVGGRGPGRAGRRRRQAALRPRRQPAQPRRHDRRRHGRPRHALVEAFVAAGMDIDQLALHFHDTYGQALANAYAGRSRPASPRSTPAPAASAAAPTPRAPPATSPPRTWSGCSLASGSSTASTSTPWSPPAFLDGRTPRPARVRRPWCAP